MAQATKEQVQRLLTIEQQTYVYISQAYEILVNINKIYITLPVSQKATFNTYRNKVGAIFNNWKARQQKLRASGNVQSFALDGIIGEPDWKERVVLWFNKLVSGNLNALPLIPIAIIAAAIIATAITAAVIVDMLTTSTGEQQSLLNAVAKLKTDFGFSDSQINNLMKHTKPSGGLFAGLFTGAGAILIGALVVFNWDKIKKIFQ